MPFPTEQCSHALYENRDHLFGNRFHVFVPESSRVDPSMSVNTNVTVPDGCTATVAGLQRPLGDGEHLG